MTYINELTSFSKENQGIEDLFIIVYCIVSNSFQIVIGSQKKLRRSNNNNPKFTDQEVITIALVGELYGENSSRAWWNYMNKNYRYLFPDLCSRTRLSRRIKKLKITIEMIRQNFLYQLDTQNDSYRIVDSFPVRLSKLARVKNSTKPFEYFAAVGYNDSFKEFFYGFKIHLLSDLRGVPVALVVTPAFPHDVKCFRVLLDEIISLGLHNMKIIVVADKGYVGKDYAKQIKEQYNVELLAIQKKSKKEPFESSLNILLRKSRHMIETTISVFTEVFNMNWTYCRSISGFLTKVLLKLTACNLANYMNSIMGRPLMEVKSFVK